MDTKKWCHGIEKWWERNTQAQCLGIRKWMLQHHLYASSMPKHPKVNAAACEAKQMSRGLNAMASKNECLGIGSALEKKSESDFD